jgi:predicted ATP-grasp superfamily ATP-dependent carboligase
MRKIKREKKMEEQDIQLILEMLKEIKADKEEMETNRKKDKEDLMAKLDIYQAKTDAVLLAMQVMETSHKETVTENKPETEVKTMACQEMEAHQEEKLTSLDRKPEAAEEEEVPVEDAVMKPVNGRKKRQSGKKQAAERCEEPEELTRGICGFTQHMTIYTHSSLL